MKNIRSFKDYFMNIKILIHRINHRFKSDRLISSSEHKRLQSTERYTFTQTNLFGKKLKIVDACTFLSSLDEIFVNEIYKFKTNCKDITIIDCGANIGLATIYFKMNFPDAKVVAYEPDPNIFKVMEENVKNQGFGDISIKNEAVSNKGGFVNFYMEGGHSGMIVHEKGADRIIRIKSTRLKDVLNQFESITFLKIDIEGHERFVIPDIIDELKKVKFLFLEYHSFINLPQNLDMILSIISGAGFRYYIKESSNKKQPFDGKELFYGMDMLVNVFCYRN